MELKANIVDATGERYKIELAIKQGTQFSKLDWDTLKQVDSYKTLSISGYGEDCGGQIYSTIQPRNAAQENLISFWKRWHLNDLKAGSKAQTKILENIPKFSSNHYSESCELLKEQKLQSDRGYIYGSLWLLEQLPEDIEQQAKEIFEKLEEEEEEENETT